MAAEQFKHIEERLWTLAKRIEQDLQKLEGVVEALALTRITTIRAELKLANHDRKELRKELLLLHSLLNNEVKSMQPNQTGNQYQRKPQF